MDKPALARIMFDAIEGNLMIVFGQHASQKVPIQGRCSTRPVQRYRIVRRLPKVVGRWIENANGVGRHGSRFGEWMVGHVGIYSMLPQE